jgi:hypothetical protein
MTLEANKKRRVQGGVSESEVETDDAASTK